MGGNSQVCRQNEKLTENNCSGSINSGNRGVEKTNKLLIIVISKHYTLSFIIQLTCKQDAFAIFTRINNFHDKDIFYNYYFVEFGFLQ